MKKVFKEYAITLGLIWVGCLIVFVFMYMLVLKPQGGVKKEVARQLYEKKNDYISTYEASNEEVKKQLLVELKELQSHLNDYVADTNVSANLTFDISSIANENNVLSFSIKGRDSKGTVEIADCKLIGQNRLDISFNGDFRQFAMFLNALERHVPVIFVDSFSITSSNNDREKPRVIMMLSVFVEKENSKTVKG